MQIHHLEVRRSHERVLDPITGRIVLKSNQYLAAATTSAITYEQEGYRVQPDGTFEVPDEVAAYYLKQEGWFVGENPFAGDIAAEAAKQEAKAAEERKAEEAAEKRKAAGKTTA